MIAVFTRYQEDFDKLRTFPRYSFNRVTSLKDARMNYYTGTIVLENFYLNDDVSEAYEELKTRQPQIFK